MSKQNIILTALVALAVVSAAIYFSSNKTNEDIAGLSPTPSFIATEISPTNLPTLTPSPKLGLTKIPLPSGNGITSFIGETVPWSLLLTDASCELKGEIKFLNKNTYDNQDAVFIYRGIDHPGRNILWSVSPPDDVSVGPNIFSSIPIPNGESLLGISLPENPKSKKYELTAKIKYGRQVDDNGKFVTAGGNVKIFEKQCQGKTTVVLP